MAKPSAGQVISGTHGYLWYNGDIVYEVSSFEAKLKLNRETINFSGDMMADSKLMSTEGTWSAKIKKIYSRAKTVAENALKGVDTRVTLIGKLEDPDNGGTERVQVENCWFDEVTLMSFESGKVIEDELSGGFTHFKYLDSIDKDKK